MTPGTAEGATGDRTAPRGESARLYLLAAAFWATGRPLHTKPGSWPYRPAASPPWVHPRCRRFRYRRRRAGWRCCASSSNGTVSVPGSLPARWPRLAFLTGAPAPTCHPTCWRR